MGQFQWVTSPLGLLGCPASFQRLMETVVNRLANVIVYIDDLLVHSATHPEHITALDQVLQRLVQHRIKINLQKCFFGSKEVSYLGFRLTEFCAKLSNKLFTRLGTAHLTTSSHHPQCNSQAEVANKIIAKYLSSFCDDSTLDWELYLAPLMFSYNTPFHRTIKTSPFALTFGMEP
jgi:hypothetical protein